MTQSFRDFVIQMQESCSNKRMTESSHAPISHIENRIRAVKKSPQTAETRKQLTDLNQKYLAAKQKEILDADDDDFRD